MRTLLPRICRPRQFTPLTTSCSSFAAAAVKPPPATFSHSTQYAITDTKRARLKAAKKAKRAESQTPQTGIEEENVYILTFLTDKPHQDRMTALREKYFPPHRNKLDAHLTLFHALPGSRLESTIIPKIEEVARKTAPFTITLKGAIKQVVRLGKGGVALSIPRPQGGKEAKRVQHELQDTWRSLGILSPQDRKGSSKFPHYTIANKLDAGRTKEEADAKVMEVKTLLRAEYVNDEGVVEGLGLWEYLDGGEWRWVRRFDFEGSNESETAGGPATNSTSVLRDQSVLSSD